VSNSPIARLRTLGKVEGISFLFLLGVAMPIKYLAGNPLVVKYAGWVHGILFILFCVALVNVMRTQGWGVRKALKPFIASLLPFGPFLIDRGLKAEQEGAAG